jgi:hypothetical protein
MEGIQEDIPFAGGDHCWHPQCREIIRLEPRIAKCSTDRDPALPAYRQGLGRQNEMVRDFHGIGVEGLNVIGLFEADENLQGSEGERLCCVNDWTAGAVPPGRGVHAALTAEGLFPGACKDRCPDAEDPHAG